MKKHLKPLLSLTALLAFTFLMPLGWTYAAAMACLALLQGAWSVNARKPELRSVLATGALVDGLLAMLAGYVSCRGDATGPLLAVDLGNIALEGLHLNLLLLGASVEIPLPGGLAAMALLSLVPGVTGVLLARWINRRVRRRASPPGYLGSYGHRTPPPFAD